MRTLVATLSLIFGFITAIAVGLLAWFGMFFVNPPEDA